MARPARADENQLRLLVGAVPGTGADLEARSFAPFLERHLPPFAIEVVDLPGAAGLVAYHALTAAPTTPLTLGWVASPALAARMIDRHDPGLLDRLTLIGAVQEEPLVLVTAAAGTPDTLAEVLTRSAADAQSVPFGTPPAGSPPHLAARDLESAAGIALNLVPFPSVAAAREAAIDATVAAALLEFGDALAALRDGRLTGLAVTAAERVPALPDVPTFDEEGQPLAASVLRGLAAPAALPADSAARLRTGLEAVVADPEYKAQGEDSGFALIWLDGAAWAARIGAEHRRLQALWEARPWRPDDAR